jgi:hypothetical protein
VERGIQRAVVSGYQQHSHHVRSTSRSPCVKCRRSKLMRGFRHSPRSVSCSRAASSNTVDLGGLSEICMCCVGQVKHEVRKGGVQELEDRGITGHGVWTVHTSKSSEHCQPCWHLQPSQAFGAHPPFPRSSPLCSHVPHIKAPYPTCRLIRRHPMCCHSYFLWLLALALHLVGGLCVICVGRPQSTK